MNKKVVRALIALVLAIAAGSTGYTLRGESGATPNIPAVEIAAPAADSVRVVYSLDQKQADKELIAIIDDADEYIYFAIYTFTLHSIADALVAAKKRGVVVKGIMDSEQSRNSYGYPITEKLLSAGIPLVTEKHESGNGIMHIKLLVTEKAYAFGSYNWTNSATTINDEIIEIGTDQSLRQTYENILKKLLDAYALNSAAAGAAAPVSVGVIDYTEAGDYVGEHASVRGKLVKAYTSKSGTVFLDFCSNYKTCPFSGVIFADDAKKFGSLTRYEGSVITITGKISLYQGRAEIILSDPGQITQ